MTIERKSAAIMFTDIAGYTEIMSESEQKALDILRKKRSIIRPLIDNHKGTFVKEIGDGNLFAWIFFYWAFVLFKDKNYINLSYDYLMSFSSNIPDDSKNSFLKTTIPKMIVEAWKKIK